MLRGEDGYEEICCGISWLRAVSFGGAGVAGADRLHRFAGEPYGGAGTGGRGRGAVLRGAVAAQLVPAVSRGLGRMGGIFAAKPRPTLLLMFAATILFALGLHAQTTGPRPQASASTVTALFLSDIHLNPFHDPALLATLTGPSVPIPALPPSPALAAVQDFCRKLPDTPDALFRSSLAAIRPRAASVSFVTVSGDLLSHQFPRCFAAL